MKENFKEGINKVGSIMLKKWVCVTDPCYEIENGYNYLFDNVIPGTYDCFVVLSDEGRWGLRVSELNIVNREYLHKYDDDLNKVPYSRRRVSCIIGVDSGQCGIFDADYYEEHQPSNNYDNDSSWYRNVCRLTNPAGITDDYGVVCMSGFGDGGYPLYVAKEKRKVVAMKVRFI